jgi:hypothetical protein
MSRNKQANQRFRPTPAPKDYDPGWLDQQFRTLEQVLSLATATLEGGPITGQTIGYDFPFSGYDNTLGGADATIRLRLVTECIFEPLFFGVTAHSVTVVATTCALRYGTAETDVLSATPITLAVGTNLQTNRAASADFAVTEIPRQTILTVVLVVPIGAALEGFGARLVGYRGGRIPAAGTTGTLGR